MQIDETSMRALLSQKVRQAGGVRACARALGGISAAFISMAVNGDRRMPNSIARKLGFRKVVERRVYYVPLGEKEHG